MTINELIQRLEDYRDELGGDADVRLMTQQQWPFENHITGFASTDEMEWGGDRDAEDCSAVLYIVEGGQIGYGTKRAWEVAS